MPFDSPDVNLGQLLGDVGSGQAQLPDFQREWKWDTDRIASLLASISLGYPVGVVMMLEVGGAEVNFKPRPLAGVKLPGPTTPGQLVLDGQQRLTSLFQSLASGSVVETKDPRGKRLTRWYYLDVAQALDGDREDAVLAVPEDRKVRSDFGRVVDLDLSTTALECEHEMFPLAKVFDNGAIFEWFNSYAAGDPTRGERWLRFYNGVLENIIHYTVPVIVLKKETTKEAVCTVFEKVNTGGVVLTVFELLTATFAADDFRLNDDWAARRVRLVQQPALRNVESTDLLQAVTLLKTWDRRRSFLAGGGAAAGAPGVSCKRGEVLRLTRTDYERWAEPVTEALLWAAAFLAGEHIFQAADVPYRTQLVPLAAIRVALGTKAETHGVIDHLRQWYWCGVMGEQYGGTTETRFARDLAEVVAWVEGVGEGGERPSTIVDANFNPGRLLTLRTRNSAAYKGLYALLMAGGCQDWQFNRAVDLAFFFGHKVDIHHVFPKAWCAQNGIDRDRQESIVNKTAISSLTNQTIGGRAPSTYLSKLEEKASLSSAALDDIVTGHCIEPAHLRTDAFDAYFEARSAALLALIAEAMGKPVLGAETVAADDPADFEDEAAEPDEELPTAMVAATG